MLVFKQVISITNLKKNYAIPNAIPWAKMYLPFLHDFECSDAITLETRQFFTDMKRVCLQCIVKRYR